MTIASRARSGSVDGDVRRVARRGRGAQPLDARARAVRAADRVMASARHGFRLEESANACGIDFVHQGADVRRAARAHHAAGGGDGRGGRRRRFRPRRLAGFLRHQQRRGQPQSPLSQQGRRHVRRCRARDGARRRESRGHRRVDGRGLGRLRQRRVRGSLPLQVRPARALSQRRRTRVRPRVRARGAARLGQRQRRHLVGLRRRRHGSTSFSRATGPKTSISGT